MWDQGLCSILQSIKYLLYRLPSSDNLVVYDTFKVISYITRDYFAEDLHIFASFCSLIVPCCFLVEQAGCQQRKD